MLAHCTTHTTVLAKHFFRKKIAPSHTTATAPAYHMNRSKVNPRTGHEGPEEEQMYSSALPSTSALDGVGGQRDVPAALPPGKTRFPLCRRLGGPQGRSGRVRKVSSHRDSIPGPSSPWRVAIPTALFRSLWNRRHLQYCPLSYAMGHKF